MSVTAPKTRTPAVFPPFTEAQPTSSLAMALSAFQAEAPTFRKSKTAKVRPKAGGEYSYRYADLGDILPVVGPLLARHGLSWSSKPGRGPDGELVLHFTLRHVGGETDEGEMPLGVERNCKPQELGSALTYMRRYALTAQLNIATDEDDDAVAANESTNGSTTASTVRPTAAAPKDSGRPASAKQRSLIEARAREADLTASYLANVLLVAAEKPATGWQNEEAAQRWLARALDRLPAAHVDAVLAGINEAQMDGRTA